MGLAGGLNLYGFVHGDPVNFSDPFGLCDRPGEPPCEQKPTGEAMAQQALENLKQEIIDVSVAVLDKVSDALDAVVPLKSAFTAAGLNPGAHSTGDRIMGAVNLALAVVPVAAEGATAVKLVDGMSMNTGAALDAAASFLGEGYSEAAAGSGRFVSGDGLRQIRMGAGDLLGAHGSGPHMNFEVLAPNPARPGTNTVVQNIHVNLIDP